jgi:ATP-binding cassette, subfamily B (MDR/TAP), member 1
MHALHFASACCAAFWKGWKLTLVMMSVLPLLAGAGMAFGALLGKLASKSSEAYGRANSIVQQVRAGFNG